MDYSELNTTQRVALVAFGIMAGESYHTAELQRLFCLTPSGVYRMMVRMSGVLPIYQGDDLRWRRVERRIDSTSTHP